MKLIKECVECGKVIEISMTFEQYMKWKYKKDLVQNIFPELSKEVREVLISGICPKCWENMVNLHDYEPGLVQLAKEGDVVFVQQLVKNTWNKWEPVDFKGKVIKVEYDEENVEYVYHVQIENSDKVIKTTDVWKY